MQSAETTASPGTLVQAPLCSGYETSGMADEEANDALLVHCWCSQEVASHGCRMQLSPYQQLTVDTVQVAT